MEEKNYNFPFGGVVLVTIGVFLLLRAFEVIEFHWSLYLIIVGAIFFIAAIRSSEKGGVFPGTILLLTGLLFYLRYNYIIDDSFAYLWPVFPIIVGIAFFVLFVFRPNEWGLIIPGSVLLAVGFVFVAYNYDMWDINPFWILYRYWPVILIAIGIKMVIDGRKKT